MNDQWTALDKYFIESKRLDALFKQNLAFYRFSNLLGNRDSSICERHHFIIQHPDEVKNEWRCTTCDRVERKAMAFKNFVILPCLSEEQIAVLKNTAMDPETSVKKVLLMFFKEGEV